MMIVPIMINMIPMIAVKPDEKLGLRIPYGVRGVSLNPERETPAPIKINPNIYQSIAYTSAFKARKNALLHETIAITGYIKVNLFINIYILI